MIAIAVERPSDAAAIADLHDAALGLDRFEKTVYRLRDGVAPLPALCFVGCENGKLVASIRFWPVLAGDRPALLLGPVAVNPLRQGLGFGHALMRHSLDAARDQGHRAVMLVGDPEYYERFGFARQPVAQLQLPGWVELRRFLGLELVPGGFAGAAGPVRPASQPALCVEA